MLKTMVIIGTSKEMVELTPYEEACIRAKKRIEYKYAVESGMEPVEKRSRETEAEFRHRIRETIRDAPIALRSKMKEDKRKEYTMLRREYNDN